MSEITSITVAYKRSFDRPCPKCGKEGTVKLQKSDYIRDSKIERAKGDPQLCIYPECKECVYQAIAKGAFFTKKCDICGKLGKCTLLEDSEFTHGEGIGRDDCSGFNKSCVHCTGHTQKPTPKPKVKESPKPEVKPEVKEPAPALRDQASSSPEVKEPAPEAKSLTLPEEVKKNLESCEIQTHEALFLYVKQFSITPEFIELGEDEQTDIYDMVTEYCQKLTKDRENDTLTTLKLEMTKHSLIEEKEAQKREEEFKRIESLLLAGPAGEVDKIKTENARLSKEVAGIKAELQKQREEIEALKKANTEYKAKADKFDAMRKLFT